MGNKAKSGGTDFCHHSARASGHLLVGISISISISIALFIQFARFAHVHYLYNLHNCTILLSSLTALLFAERCSTFFNPASRSSIMYGVKWVKCKMGIMYGVKWVPSNWKNFFKLGHVAYYCPFNGIGAFYFKFGILIFFAATFLLLGSCCWWCDTLRCY